MPRPASVVISNPDRLLLRSRFGRRLLLVFLGCALLPTLTIAFFSFRSVRDQLTDQADERLHALAQFAGTTIFDRLAMLDADLRNRVSPCLGRIPTRLQPDRCTDFVADGFEHLVLVAGRDTLTLLGSAESVPIRAALAGLSLVPAQSTVRPEPAPAENRLLMVHRLGTATSRPAYLIGAILPDYLWADYDQGTLPDPVMLTLWHSTRGDLLRSGPDSVVIRAEVLAQMERSANGGFEWTGSDGSYRAAYWTFPESRRFLLSGVRAVVSQSEADVIAPMRDFTQTFPFLLLAALLMVLVIGINQIRRRVVPLEALHEATRRIARHDFGTEVKIKTGDEIEDLAVSFNTMATQVAKQFSALETAADIDRSVLSLVDRPRIAETALTRLPELISFEAATLALLESADRSEASIWTTDQAGTIHLAELPLEIGEADLALIRTGPDRHVLEPGEPAWPSFAAPIAHGAASRIDIYPVRFGEEAYGVLSLRRGVSDDATPEGLIQIRHFVDQLAVALGNARMVERVRFLAFYDSLTGLPNRLLYKERLGHALLRAERRGYHVALCFLDLDQFSSINDSLGHDLGDALIQQVANRLLTLCRGSDTVARLGGERTDVEVARLGGDEFTVVLPDLVDPQDAGRVARRLLGCFREPFRLGTHEVFVSTSIGIAVYPEDGRDIDDLLKNADVAMYYAKEEGRNNYRMYSPTMNAEAVARMELEQHLRRAVEAREFALVYQPIVELETGRVVAAESLVRWNHPERGVVSPAEFISLSEESGLIVRLGEWILRTVCAQACNWQRIGLGRLSISVNLSARQLQHQDIVVSVREILEDTGLDPALLVMELTESVLMRPEGQVANSIRALADLGVRFAVDDFGTGYSSLSYLKHFPVDTLKIDRAFVRQVTDDSDDAAITTAIIALARALDMSVVAEGVETEEQARFLKDLGCHRIQGYLIGSPMTPEAFAEFLSSDQVSVATGDRARSAT